MTLNVSYFHFQQNARGPDSCPISSTAFDLRINHDRENRIADPFDGRFVRNPPLADPSSHFQQIRSAQRYAFGLHNCPHNPP